MSGRPRRDVNQSNRLLRAWLVLLALLALPTLSFSQSVEYYHLDSVGNVLAVTDVNGAVIESHDYLPFGEEWNPQPGKQPKRFTGKERDTETGLDYFGARYYGSKIGRFTTTDPVYNWNANLADPQRWNRYAYGRSNPLRHVDPDGRDIVDYFTGAANAFGSNFAFGFLRQSGGNADFAFGQFVGDVASIPAGYVYGQAGTTAAGGGLVAAPETGGASLVISGAGVVAMAQGGTATLSGLLHAGIYLSGKVGDEGTIYKVPGSGTSSGKPYVGRHNKPNPAKTRRGRDGRDRTQAEVVDTYDASDTHEGRVKEQAQIDAHGLENLDNKRNEIRKR